MLREFLSIAVRDPARGGDRPTTHRRPPEENLSLSSLLPGARIADMYEKCSLESALTKGIINRPPGVDYVSIAILFSESGISAPGVLPSP